MNFILQFQKLLPLPFHEFADRNSCPTAHHLANILVINFFFEQSLLSPSFLKACLLLLQLLLETDQLSVLQFGCAVEIIVPFGLLDLDLHLFDLFFKRPNTGDGLLLNFPLGLEGISLGLEVGQLLFQFL